MAEQQHAPARLGVHPHHRVVGLVVVGDELLAVLAFGVGQQPAGRVDLGVVVRVGVHRPETVGQLLQRGGQLLIGGYGGGPGGGAAVGRQRDGPQDRGFGDAVDERDVGVPLLALS